MNKRPCNCGDPLSQAEVYRNKETGLEVHARKMERNFITLIEGKPTQGYIGEWFARDAQRNRYIYKDSDFTRLYEKVSQ